MALKPEQQLADVLRRARAAAASGILRSGQLGRKDREVLKRRGYLVELIKGWYALSTPPAQVGDTTFWHLNFWPFVGAYLKTRYGDRHCISPEHSLDLWTEATATPKQLVVMTAKRSVITLQLPNNGSVLIYPARKQLPSRPETRHGVQVMPLALALVRASPSYFTKSPGNAELALRMVRPEELSRVLLGDETNLTAANRLIGGLQHLGLKDAADRVEADLDAAGFSLKPVNPFDEPPRLPVGTQIRSPYVGRIESMWLRMREEVIAHFPAPPTNRPEPEEYVRKLKAIYTHDAYHSLSIEGYQVTPELIERIASGGWDPSGNPMDSAQINAMAAKGYQAAFTAVLKSVHVVLTGESPGSIFARDLQTWYRALFSPSVQAGILPSAALAGYRERRVFIRGSDHVPPAFEAVPELMDTLFALLTREESPAVRAILGHFVFVFIHPYSDGNGRIGRFLMNLMFASGGYDWTVIRVDRPAAYMAALENASVKGEIADFVRFVAEEMNHSSRNFSGA